MYAWRLRFLLDLLRVDRGSGRLVDLRELRDEIRQHEGVGIIRAHELAALLASGRPHARAHRW